MKYKNLFITVFGLLSCLGLSVGLVHTSVYGDHSKDKAEAVGIVSKVSGSTISIFSNKMNIDASKAKVKLDRCDTVMKVDDIKEGDPIEAIGKMSGESFAADQVTLLLGQLMGRVDAVGTGTVTMLGQVIDTSSVICKKGHLKVGQKARVGVRLPNLTALVIEAGGKKHAHRSSDEITPTDDNNDDNRE